MERTIVSATSWDEVHIKLGTAHVGYAGTSPSGNLMYAPLTKEGFIDPNPRIMCEFIEK